ncbi:ATP-binding protein [Candidatus Saccharibacteria bacterium]|nr:ATP-binding protein [Candidatus Saccharibacteria bacterium]
MSNPKTVHGCKYWFEAYLQKSTLDGDMWNKTLRALLLYVGIARTVKVIMHIDGNTVHYYFGANKNLSGLSNKLEKITLRPVDPTILSSLFTVKPERLVIAVPGGNILDIREKYELKRGKLLNWAIFSMKSVGDSVYTRTNLLFDNSDGTYGVSTKHMLSTPGQLIAINFRENEKYDYVRRSKHLDIQKSLHMLRSEPSGAIFNVNTFPYLSSSGYLPLASYDFDRHSFIVGGSGSGKSKFISLFVDRLLKSPFASQYRIVVIDPHASLEGDIGGYADTNVINFRNSNDSTELFSSTDADISAATELTGTLFESLLGKNYSAQVERILRFGMRILMTAQVMSLDNLRRLLIDDEYRKGILEHVNEHISENVVNYFNNDFIKLRDTDYQTSIFPIIELIDEIQVQPALSNKHKQASSLAKVINSNRLTLFSLNKIGMGDKVIKAVSGLLIQQLFLLAQARTFNEKIILIIDEVSVIQNPTIAQILAEARKYNLYVFLSQQYFGQIDDKLQNAIFSNVSNYYVFKVSEHDARLLEGNITMELPKKMLMEATRVLNKEEDLRVPILTDQDPRDCVVRVSSGGKLLPALKARTMDFVAETNYNTVLDLKSYDGSSMPAKYVEPSGGMKKTAIASRVPQVEINPQANLMEVLSRQSSHRNVIKGGKNG